MIVEDELLHFLAMKIRTLSKDEIVLLAANGFDSEWIEASKTTTTTQWNISHRVNRKMSIT